MVIEGTTPQKRKISIHQKKKKKNNPQPPQQTPPHPTSYKQPFIPHIKNTMQLITTVGQIREICFVGVGQMLIVGFLCVLYRSFCWCEVYIHNIFYIRRFLFFFVDGYFSLLWHGSLYYILFIESCNLI